jgi:hypothetical protein
MSAIVVPVVALSNAAVPLERALPGGWLLALYLNPRFRLVCER